MRGWDVLDVEQGEVVGVVGESGSGKSVSALAVMGLQLGYLLGGSILIETVFAWPGTGFLLNAANARWGSLYDAWYGTDALDAAPARAGAMDRWRNAA